MRISSFGDSPLKHQGSSTDHEEVLSDREREEGSANKKFYPKQSPKIISGLRKVFEEYESHLQNLGISIRTNLYDPRHPDLIDPHRSIETMAKILFQWILDLYADAGENPSLSIFVSVHDRGRPVFILRLKGTNLSSSERELTSPSPKENSIPEISHHLEFLGGDFRAEVSSGLVAIYQHPLPSETEERAMHGIQSSNQFRLEQQRNAPLKRQKVLFIENHPGQRVLFRLLASREQIEVIPVPDGLEALRVWNVQKDFDCIVVDYKLDNSWGDEIVKLIREDGYEGLIIGITASNSKEDLQKFLGAGIDLVVAKPFDFLDLIKIIRKRLKQMREGVHGPK